MKINGIDYHARSAALEAAGIDPDGEMDQFMTVLGTKYAYCNQHLNVHRTDGGCTVGVLEMFPLKTTGDFAEAAAECREREFRLHMEPCP